MSVLVLKDNTLHMRGNSQRRYMKKNEYGGTLWNIRVLLILDKANTGHAFHHAGIEHSTRYWYDGGSRAVRAELKGPYVIYGFQTAKSHLQIKHSQVDLYIREPHQINNSSSYVLCSIHITMMVLVSLSLVSMGPACQCLFNQVSSWNYCAHVQRTFSTDLWGTIRLEQNICM